MVRTKLNLKFKAVASRKIDKTTGLRCDQFIRLSIAKSRKHYPEKIRRIKYYDKDKELDALEIAAIYRERWQVEVFFKWIKQNLEIKKLWGHSQNAIRTQLWIAISTYLIVAYLKKQIKSNSSIYEMIQILSISTIDKTPINELFMKTKVKRKSKDNLICLITVNYKRISTNILSQKSYNYQKRLSTLIAFSLLK